MSEPMPARTISVSIQASPARVYAYCSDPRNLPAWVPSFAIGVDRVHGHWVVHTRTGDVTWQFVPENSFGVLDHTITLPDGTAIYNPMRVVPNGSGSEFSFTLFHRPGVTDEAFAQDAGQVASDLAQLKRKLETAHAHGPGLSVP